MECNTNEKNTESNDFNVKDFYNQGGTIEQLAILDTFGNCFIDSYKNQIDKWNFESMENIVKLVELYIKSGNKKLSVCAQECGIKNMDGDFEMCQNQVLLQTFCKEKELHLDRIDNAYINFLESSAINILRPSPKYLQNKQIIKEVKNGIMHKQAVSLPEGVYIYNPVGPEHQIDFRAIVRPDFTLSFLAELYFNINRCYVNRVDYGGVDFNKGFDDNADKIYIEERVPTEDILRAAQAQKNRDIIQREFLYLYDVLPFEASKQSKRRKLTAGEREQLSEFFNNHIFGEAELRFCTLDKDSRYLFLIMFIGLARSSDLTYNEFINNREVKEKLQGLDGMSHEKGRNDDLVSYLHNKYYEFNYTGLLPNYIELKDILVYLIRDIFYEDKTILDKNPEDRKAVVLKLVNDRIEKYILEYISNEKYCRERKIEIEMVNIEAELIQERLNSGKVVAKKESDVGNGDAVIWCKSKEDGSIESCYCVKDEDAYYEKNKWWDVSAIRKEAIKRIGSIDVPEYKNEIHRWEDLSQEEKESYISMMKNDIMKIFDRAFSNINYQEVKLRMNMEGIGNYLKTLNIFNYYVNDLFLTPAGNTIILSNRKHIRNAFSHNGCSVLPGVNKILFRLSGSEYVGGKPNWENVYNLQKLHNRCLDKNNNRLHQKNT